MKYRRKSEVVDVVGQWFQIGKRNERIDGIVRFDMGGRANLPTIFGGLNIENGDWIIADPDGKHYYPVKPDIFPRFYESVPEDTVSFLGVEIEGIKEVLDGLYGKAVDEAIEESLDGQVIFVSRGRVIGRIKNVEIQ